VLTMSLYCKKARTLLVSKQVVVPAFLLMIGKLTFLFVGINIPHHIFLRSTH